MSCVLLYCAGDSKSQKLACRQHRQETSAWQLAECCLVTTYQQAHHSHHGSDNIAACSVSMLSQDTSAAAAGRRLLHGSMRTKHQQRQSTLQQQPRHVRYLQAAASIPYIPATQPTAAVAAAAAADEAIPTSSPEMSLQEMLCAIEPYSPTGLQGMKLPAGKTASSSSSSGAIKCEPPEHGMFQHNNVVFRPIVVPIVFHRESLHAVHGYQLDLCSMDTSYEEVTRVNAASSAALEQQQRKLDM
jgi:hypothetical protein